MNAWIGALASRIYLANGARQAWIAMTAGAVGALAMAPIHFFPALIAPMTVGVWMIDGCGAGGPKNFRAVGRNMLHAAKAGWFIGFGYFVAGLFWLGAAFFVEPEKFAWAAPLGVLGVPAGLAFFPAAGFALAALLWRSGSSRLFAFAFALGLSEWARGTIFTGFPWNAYGMALGGNLYLAQIASIIGLYGLTVVAVYLAAAPAVLAEASYRKRLLTSPLGASGAILVGLAAFGLLRLSGENPGFVPQTQLRIMQPNIPQDEKFRASAGMELLRNYIALSDRSTSPSSPGLSAVTHLIWPESPFPFVLARDGQALAAIAAALAGKTTLLTGAIRVEGEGAQAKAYNSLVVIDPAGVIVGSYDKTHLVPFGEYLPFNDFLRAIGLTQFIAVPGGFSAGRTKRRLDVPKWPVVQPMICYEAIFPIESAGGPTPVGAQPGVLLNITNDAWFGKSFGPYQHLAQARLRAIENGAPLIRAANTGVSAVIDPYGRILKSLPLGVAGVLDSPLPKSLPPTLFSLYPYWIVSVLLSGALVLAFVGRRAP